jgi:hypothetical protein
MSSPLLKKRCPACKKLKLLSEFSRRGDGHQSVCKGCNRDYQRSHYQRNTETYKEKAAKTKKAARDLACHWIWDYFQEHPCADCGESDPVVLDFDHRDPADKVRDVSKLVAQGCRLARIQAEIAKCDVRCANCHRRRTAIQYGYTSRNPDTWLVVEVAA